MKHLQELIDMPLGEYVTFEIINKAHGFKEFFKVLRVPGGWIYYEMSGGTGMFVPEPKS